MNIHDLLPRLPEPAVLRTRCQAFALLDDLVSGGRPEHCFAEDWAPGVALASVENGSGDHYFVVFDPQGVLLLGFDHESDATPCREEPHILWPGLLDGLPETLAHYTEAPEFCFEGVLDATVCAWWETGAGQWRCGPVEFGPEETDGADFLFDLLADGSAAAYIEFAQDNWDRPVDRAAVAAVLSGSPVQPATLAALGGESRLPATIARARAFGWTVREEEPAQAHL